MDFINKAYQQVTDLFRTMSPAARITAGLLLVGVLVSLVYLFQFQIAGGDELLFGGREFSNSDLARMEAAIAKAGLNGSDIDGMRLRVPRDQKNAYIAAIIENDAMPEDFSSAFDDVLKNETGFWSSGKLREQKLDNALAKTASLIISEFKGIDYANVRFDKSKAGGLNREMNRRAAVAVKPQGDTHLTAEQVRSIQKATTGFVAGMNREDVIVTDLNAGIAHGGPKGELGESDSDYAGVKERYDRYFREKVANRLSYIPGVVVGVEVELNPQIKNIQSRLQLDPKTVTLAVSEDSEVTSKTAPARGGRPGAVPNTVASNTAAAVTTPPETKQETETRRSNTTSAASQDYSTTEVAALTPERVAVSVGVPMTYYEMIWKKENPPADGADAAVPTPGDLKPVIERINIDIENSLVKLIPKADKGDSQWEPIKVIPYTPPDMQPPEEPGVAETAGAWLAGNWQTIGVALLGLFSLVMLRGMLKSTNKKVTPPEAAASQLQLSEVDGADADATRGEADDEEEEHERRLVRVHSSGPSLRDELTDLVREDPDAAASILRNWIGDAA